MKPLFAVAQTEGTCAYATESGLGTVLLGGSLFDGETVEETTFRARVVQLCENPEPGEPHGKAEPLVIHGFAATHCVLPHGNATTVLLGDAVLGLHAGGPSLKAPYDSTVDAMVKVLGELQP